MYYPLLYDVVEDYLERRTPLRDSHLSQAREAQARGELVMAGAFGEPIEGAALVFRGDSPAAAEHFAQSDPYVQQGLVTRWRVQPWHVVVGSD